MCTKDQETQTVLFVMISDIVKLCNATDDLDSSAIESASVASTDCAEMGIDPNAIFEDFVPRIDAREGFFVNDIDYYKNIAKVIEKNVQSVDSSLGFAYSSVVFQNFENVNPLQRVEFLSPEYQRFLQTGSSIRTYSENDLIFEDRYLNMENCKKAIMARRDFFFGSNGSTRGDLFLLNEIQNRSLMTTWCRTPKYDVTTHMRCTNVECWSLFGKAWYTRFA